MNVEIKTFSSVTVFYLTSAHIRFHLRLLGVFTRVFFLFLGDLDGVLEKF